MAKVIEICAPFAADIKTLADVPDPVFAEKMMGEGLALEPKETKEETIRAICDGEITIFHTKHAVTFANQGVEVLLHFGIDTVKLDGEHFTTLTEDTKVKKGQEIIKVNVELVKKQVPSVITPIVVPDDSEIEKIEFSEGSVKAGDVIMKLHLK